MTDYPESALASSVREALEAVSLIRLRVASIERGGVSWPAIRPDGMPGGAPGFSVALVQDPLTVSAQFVADDYSGALLRAIGDKVHTDPSSWYDQVKRARELRISLEILVNGLPFESITDESLPWGSLEIEARIRTRRWRSPENLADLWGAAAGTCLSLILSGLNVKTIDEFPAGLPEGAKTLALVNRYERNPVNRLRSIQYHGYACWVCDVSLSEQYGPLGDSYIEVHHILPVSAMPDNYRVNPVTEMVPLCPNCHSMAHRKNPPIHPVRLRQIRGRPERTSVFRSDFSGAAADGRSEQN